MRKHFLLLCCVLLCGSFVGLRAQTFPTLSNETEETWYYILFNSAEDVVAEQGEGEIPLVAIPTGRDAQLWKVEGSESDGYTLTSKTGQRLYVNPATYSTNLRTAKQPAKGERFRLTPYGAGYEIIPTTAPSLSLNPWGGNSIGAKLALYNKNDPNAVVRFVPASEFAEGPVVSIIPYPQSVVKGEGRFDLKSLTAISYCNDTTKALAETLAAELKAAADINVAVSDNAGGGTTLRMVEDATLKTEAYRLDITTDGVLIAAASRAGFYYALQSLRQMMPAAIYGGTPAPQADWTLPCVAISDAPEYEHRGFMLDIARYFFDKEEVKKLLDMAAIYKLNRFHWHLTDDQGWRIEIPEYPRLTTVGAVRSRSLVVNDLSYGKEFYDDTEYGRGCFYTLDDLREIVDYAKERNIEIIPEVDMPGHMVAAIASYPELSCDPTKSYEVRVGKGISTDILNIGNDHVIDFLKCVLDHICEVFPYKLVHLGGDECPNGQWRTNADCQRRIEEEGLAGVDELQPWLLETLGSYLRDKYGKEVVAWNELQNYWRSDYTVNPIIMAYSNQNVPKTSVEKGFRYIAVPSTPLYMDLLQATPEQMDIDAPYIGGYGDGMVNSIERVYAYNPIGAINESQKEYCVGTQANLWTESCTSNEEAEYQYFPRLLALSEVAWLPVARKSYVSFYQRLQRHAEVLDRKNVNYARYAIEPAEQTEAEATAAEARDLLNQSQPGAVGHPSQAAYDALASALNGFDEQNEADIAPLKAQIAAYKASAPTQPVAGKYYQIVSASTYYKERFAGSTVYEKNGKLFFHYTPQLEPEEVWTFVPDGSGAFRLRQAISGNYVDLPAYNSAATLSENPGCAFSIATPTTPAGPYTFIPGVVTISDASARTGSTDVKRLYGNMSGQVIAFDNTTYCYPATWRIVEITDFRAFMEHLVGKCERLLETANPDKPGEPTAEALAFLSENVLGAARVALQGSEVTEESYMQVAALYQQFLDMPRSSYADHLSEDCYYYITNAYHTTKYAKADDETVVPSNLTSAADNSFRWRFKKNKNGTVSIVNKATETGAYVAMESVDQTVKLGRDYAWTLQEITTDTGGKGLAIMDGSGAYSWYTNPGQWDYILLKPYDWGASIWTLTPIADDPTGIAAVETDKGEKELYDLSGRRTNSTGHGIYVTRNGQKIMQ